MPNPMEDGELETSMAAAVEVDSYEFEHPDDGDNYVTAKLYKLDDGRHFRVVDGSGMNSIYDGASDIGEWLEPGEVASWTKGLSGEE